MAKALGSGLAIGGAVAAVVVAGIAIYSGMSEELPPDVVPEAVMQTPAVPEMAESAPEVTTPVSEVVEATPVVAEPEPAPNAVEAETETGIKVAIITPKSTVDLADTTNTATLPTPPSFDLVRVDETGSAVIAGKATANTTVEIMLDSQVVSRAKTDASGAFVALIDLDPSDQPRELTLVEKPASGVDVASIDKVLVMPFKPDATAAPKLIVAKADTVEVIAPVEPVTTAQSETTDVQMTEENTPAPEVSENTQVAASEDLTLDTILYDDLGDVVITGHGNRDEFVRIYLDNEPADIQKVPDDGQWKITLTDVPDGLYELRVDSVDSKGAVTERVESPLKREAVELVKEATKLASNITIQPGYTLWALAEKRYGSGVRYVQIFEANRDRIKDPDLIYPGQVFDLPN